MLTDGLVQRFPSLFDMTQRKRSFYFDYAALLLYNESPQNLVAWNNTNHNFGQGWWGQLISATCCISWVALKMVRGWNHPISHSFIRLEAGTGSSLGAQLSAETPAYGLDFLRGFPHSVAARFQRWAEGGVWGKERERSKHACMSQKLYLLFKPTFGSHIASLLLHFLFLFYIEPGTKTHPNSRIGQ